MANLIIVLAIVIPAAMLFGFVLVWRYLFERDRRRSPLNFKLLSLPGDRLRQQIAEEDEALSEAAAMAVMVGPILLMSWLVARMSRVIKGWEDVQLGWGDATFAVAAILMLVWAARKFVVHGRRRRTYRQGLEAELATAQNLTSLIAEGCMVFHDFPADKFNIDHIVIGPSAVFAIETKSRKKPSDGGRGAARVGYDGKLLKFPTHGETQPIEQARRQAKWLEQFLASGAGDPVKVIPVVALPGWYVELSKEGSRGDVIVNNCRNPAFILSPGFGPPLEASLRKRIAHALTERYPRAE